MCVCVCVRVQMYHKSVNVCACVRACVRGGECRCVCVEVCVRVSTTQKCTCSAHADSACLHAVVFLLQRERAS